MLSKVPSRCVSWYAFSIGASLEACSVRTVIEEKELEEEEEEEEESRERRSRNGLSECE